MKKTDNSNSNKEVSGGDLLTFVFIFLFLLIGVYMIYDNVSERLKTKDSKTTSQFTPKQYDSIQMHQTIQDSLLSIEMQKQQDEADEKIRSYVKAIHDSYNELMSFKNNQRFHQLGFGRGGPYHQWLVNVDRIINNPINRELYDRYGFGVLDLKSLGLEYVSTQGRENDFTRTIKGRLSRFFRESNNMLLNGDPAHQAKLMNSELEQQSGTYTDSRDGQTYKWVKIGSQVWMAENLNFSTNSGSWCYDNNTTNCNRYGRLYNWQTARDACPPGWHLPNDAEWSQLTNYLRSNIGTRLKSRNGWSENGNGTDEFGFSALPGGTRVGSGVFGLINYHGYWWTATSQRTNDAWLRIVYYNYSNIDRISDSKELGLSVRCVRD